LGELYTDEWQKQQGYQALWIMRVFSSLGFVITQAQLNSAWRLLLPAAATRPGL
jgi:hypothetical protein